MRFVLKQPTAKSMSGGCLESVRLHDTYQSSKERLKYGFVDFET